MTKIHHCLTECCWVRSRSLQSSATCSFILLVLLAMLLSLVVLLPLTTVAAIHPLTQAVRAAVQQQLGDILHPDSKFIKKVEEALHLNDKNEESKEQQAEEEIKKLRNKLKRRDEEIQDLKSTVKRLRGERNEAWHQLDNRDRRG